MSRYLAKPNTHAEARAIRLVNQALAQLPPLDHSEAEPDPNARVRALAHCALLSLLFFGLLTLCVFGLR